MKWLSVILVFISFNLSAQVGDWLEIYEGSISTISIDIKNLESFKEDEIYVWAKEDFELPIRIETIPGKIYHKKTYYLINKKLQRFSMVSIIYYDIKENVIKAFNYDVNSQVEDYHYNCPILPKSNEEKILSACLAIINNDVKK